MKGEMDGRFGVLALGIALAIPGCGRSIDFDADTPLSCAQDADCPASLVCDGDSCVEPGGADTTTASSDGATAGDDGVTTVGDDGTTAGDDGATTIGDDGGTTTHNGGLDLPGGDDGGVECGDGVVEPPEQCDGADLNGFDCEALGYASGELTCDPVTCMLDVSDCMIGMGGTTGS